MNYVTTYCVNCDSCRGICQFSTENSLRYGDDSYGTVQCDTSITSQSVFKINADIKRVEIN